MKKLSMILGFILMSGSLWAQTDEPVNEGKNEIRLNMLNTLLGSIEPQYERIFDDNSALNLFLGIGYQLEESAYSHYFSLTPAYRQYFGKKPGSGFFLEANMSTSYNGWNEYLYPEYNPDNPNSYEPIGTHHKGMNLGVGVGMGLKFVTNTNLVGTLKGGIGRMITTNYKRYAAYYPNIEISIGKRF